MSEITTYSATQLAQFIKKKSLSCIEVATAFIEKIDVVNPNLNALVQYDPEAVLAKARQADIEIAKKSSEVGPFHGVPFTIKDNINLKGFTVSYGCAGLKDNIAKETATAVQRLISAGGIPLGLTNTPELGISIESDNLVYGKTLNPHHSDYSCGGSSGGEAALIAAAGSPCGIGGDHGGGLRYPAHCCGITCLRPSQGRWPLTGFIFPKRGFSVSSCRMGPLSRHISDLKLMLNICEGAAPGDPFSHNFLQSSTIQQPVKIALILDNTIQSPVPEIQEDIITAAKALISSHCQVEERELPEYALGFSLARALFTVDSQANLPELLEKLSPCEISPYTKAWLKEASGPSRDASELIQLWQQWDEFQIKIAHFMERFDAIICPVAPTTAPYHGETLQNNTLWPAISYTAPFSLTKMPIVVVPAGTNHAGLPFGMQIITRPGEDELALDIAAQVTGTSNPQTL